MFVDNASNTLTTHILEPSPLLILFFTLHKQLTTDFVISNNLHILHDLNFTHPTVTIADWHLRSLPERPRPQQSFYPQELQIALPFHCPSPIWCPLALSQLKYYGQSK